MVNIHYGFVNDSDMILFASNINKKEQHSRCNEYEKTTYLWSEILMRVQNKFPSRIGLIQFNALQGKHVTLEDLSH